MSFQFQLLTQLDGIRKHIKEEDIDKVKIHKWLLKTLQESSKPELDTLNEMDELYNKLFHTVSEKIKELKLLRPDQLRQEIEDTFGEKPEKKINSTQINSISTAARKLGISRTTLYDKINKGMINTTLDGKIHEDEIIRYLSGK